MKRSGTLFLVSLALASLVMLSGCASAPKAGETESFKAAVDKLFTTWGDTNVHPDLEGFVAIWDENAVKMAAGKPTLIGPANIRQFKQKAFGAMIYDKFDIKVEEYQFVGQFGWARGIYTIVSHPKAGGDQITDYGAFLTVFKKQDDGTWRVYRDTMMPLPK